MADERGAQRATVTSPCVLVGGRDPHASMLVAQLAADSAIAVTTDAMAAAAVILVDPDDNHWERARSTGRPVVLLSLEPLAADAMLAAVIRGADAVIDRSATVDELAAAVDAVLNGGVVLSAEFTRRLADALRAAAMEDRPVVLSRRERQILECISAGRSVKETATTLEITPKTVENLQTRLYRKLGVRNRNQAVALARALGMIS